MLWEIWVRNLIGASRVTLLSVTWMFKKLMWAILVHMLQTCSRNFWCVFFSCENWGYLCSNLLVQNIVADMRKVLAKNPQVEKQKLHRRVFLENVNPENQAVMLSVSFVLLWKFQLLFLGFYVFCSVSRIMSLFIYLLIFLRIHSYSCVLITCLVFLASNC